MGDIAYKGPSWMDLNASQKSSAPVWVEFIPVGDESPISLKITKLGNFLSWDTFPVEGVNGAGKRVKLTGYCKARSMEPSEYELISN